MTDTESMIEMLETAQRGFTFISQSAGKETKASGLMGYEQIRDFAYSRAAYIEELLQKINPK
jgi:hypothetical protein